MWVERFLGDNRIGMEVSVMNSPNDVEIALKAVALLSRIVGSDSSIWPRSAAKWTQSSASTLRMASFRA
jgi:hypothetical protein